MNSYILLWLEGPLQSWGDSSKYGPRRTLPFPTKSAIHGILLAAMGAKGPQEELLATLSRCAQTVISFSQSSLLIDYHMVGSGYDEKDPWQRLCIPKKQDGKPAVGGGSKITYRYYLEDAKFAIIQELQEELLAPVIKGLKCPVYGPSLGRKSSVPTEFIYQGTYDTEENAIRGAEQLAETKNLTSVFRVREGVFEEGENRVLSDVPLRFGPHKRYGERRINIVYE